MDKKDHILTTTKEVSSGGQGTTYRATLDGLPLLAKAYRVVEWGELRQQIQVEIDLVKKLGACNHEVIGAFTCFKGVVAPPAILRTIITSNLDEFAYTGAPVLLLYEFLEGEELHNFVKAGSLTVDRKISIIRQLLQILVNHARIGIVNRDIKTHNLIYNPATDLLKIIDYGFGCRIAECRLRTRVGTDNFMGPEVITERVETEHAGAIDIFAAGMTMYAIVTGSDYIKTIFDPATDPYTKDKSRDYIVKFTYYSKKIQESRADLFTDLKKEVFGLILRMIQPLPELRPTAQEALDTFNSLYPPGSAAAAVAAVVAAAAPGKVMGGAGGPASANHGGGAAAAAAATVVGPAAAAAAVLEGSPDLITLTSPDGTAHNIIIDETKVLSRGDRFRTSIATFVDESGESGPIIVKEHDVEVGDMPEILQSIQLERTLRESYGSCDRASNIVCFMGIAADASKKELLDGKDFFTVQTPVNPGRLYFLYEYIEGDNLQKYIKDGGEWSPAIVQHILASVKKLHDAHIIHRDIKPENIMIEIDSYNVRLIDFERSCLQDTCQFAKVSTYPYLGPESFMALPSLNAAFPDREIPKELVEGMTTALKKDARCVDVYAVGATLFYLVFRKDWIKHLFRTKYPDPELVKLGVTALTHFMVAEYSELYEAELDRLIAKKRGKRDVETVHLLQLIKLLVNPDYESRISIDDAIAFYTGSVSVAAGAGAGAGANVGGRRITRKQKGVRKLQKTKTRRS